MKRVFVLVLFLSFSSVFATDYCLSGQTAGEIVKSKIIGLFVRNSDDTSQTRNRVIIDIKDCTLTTGSGNVTLGDATKNHGYLEFGKGDDAMLAFLINAYNRSQTVNFRLWTIASGSSSNQIKYVEFAD